MGAEKALNSLQSTVKQLHIPDIEDKDSELIMKYDRVITSLSNYIGRLTVELAYHRQYIKPREDKNGEGL